MLPAAQRLRRTSDIQHVYKTGRSVFTPVLRLLAVPTALSHSRATVVVSNRVSNRAVDRNRLKRRLRVDLQPLLKQMVKTHDIVVIVQAKALQSESGQLTTALQQAFTKARLLK